VSTASARPGSPPERPPAEGAVRIESLAAGGDGVAHLADGMTVFVPRTAPGDEVLVAGLRRRRRYARAEAARILVAGASRVSPPCAHFEEDRCGGCQWQHLAPDAQRQAKARIVGDALRRLGGLDLADPDLVPSPRGYGYRSSITLTVNRTARGPVAGFHRADDASVFPLHRCEIACAELNDLWRAIGPALGSVPAGDDLRMRLRRARDGGLHVILSGGRGPWTAAGALGAAAAAGGCAATVWQRTARGTPRRLAGPDGEREALAFGQVNEEVAQALRAAVVEAVPDAARRVLDLYGGTGDAALALAGADREVVLVEADDEAARSAAERASRQGADLEVRAARVEDVIRRLLPADVVLVNPPRSGLAPGVSAALAEQAPETLVYVSCDPATLARDLARLGARADRLSVRCFDMFPQTSHVETLAVLRRAGGTPPGGGGR
jgi:23S rRNA (uracil1939-C5)-methyltransferase